MSWATFWWSVLVIYVVGVFVAGTTIGVMFCRVMPKRKWSEDYRLFPTITPRHFPGATVEQIIAWSAAGIGCGFIWPIAAWVVYIAVRSGAITSMEHMTPEDITR